MRYFIFTILISWVLTGICCAQQDSQALTRIRLYPELGTSEIIARDEDKSPAILAEFVTLEALEAYLAKLPGDSKVKLVYESEAFFGKPSASKIPAYVKAVDWFCYEHHIKFRKLVIRPTMF